MRSFLARLDAYLSRNKVSCDACGSVFCNQRQLILHKAASHNKPKVSCGQCGKKFSQKWLLDRHSKAASNYECEDCNLTYCNVQDLISHNYHQHKCIKCEQCGKVYPEENFRHHMQSVHNEICAKSVQQELELEEK